LSDLLLVGPSPPPSGGIASHLAALARALATRGVSVRRVDPHDRLRFVGGLAARGALHLHVCGHNRASYALLGVCLASRRRPVIATLHSGLAPAWLAGLDAGARQTIAVLLGRCAAVVAVNPVLGALARDLGARGVIVAPAFIAEGLRPGRLPARVAAARQATGALVAVTVAPGAEYGVDVLASAFARVPGATLVAFGPGGADHELARTLAARGHGDRVVAAGELDERSALAVLAAADVFVRPTRADGDAVSVREALALGTRVVASDAAPRPDGVTTFPTGDPRALAEAIVRALAATRPAPVATDGLGALLALYRKLGIVPREDACAASPDA
jgi:glycosyltransferase involved in cell wall biosynthesis